MSSFAQFLFKLILQYKYALLFPVAVIEGPLITFASGFLVSQGVLNPIIALVVLVAADVVSDLACYAIGRFGRDWRITQWMFNKFGFDVHKGKVEAAFRERGGKTLFVGKVTHALSIVFMLGAGYFRMNIFEFILYCTIGTIIKSSIFMYVGYLAGAAYIKYANNIGIISGIILVSVIVFALLFALWKKNKKTQ